MVFDIGRSKIKREIMLAAKYDINDLFGNSNDQRVSFLFSIGEDSYGKLDISILVDAFNLWNNMPRLLIVYLSLAVFLAVNRFTRILYVTHSNALIIVSALYTTILICMM